MKQVILKSIRLQNWKGQDRFLSFSDSMNVIKGRNGSGKTSVYKAFCWLLTGYTDAVNVKNHELFDNKVEVTSETPAAVVTAVISIDGREYTIERSATPGFSRKRSTNEWVKSPSDNYMLKIDEVETKVSDFNDFLTDTFGTVECLPFMLMGERFANIMIDDRNKARKILEQVVGDITLADMKGDYKSISADIEQYGVEVLQDRYKNQLRPLRKALEDNDAIVSIKRKDLSSYQEIDFEQIQSEIDSATKRIAAIDEELAGDSKSMEIEMKRRNDAMMAVSNAEYALSEYVAQYNAGCKAEIAAIERELLSIEEENEAIRKKNKRIEYDYNINNSRINADQLEYSSLTNKRNELVKRRNEIKAMVFNGEKCQFCGQALPPSMASKLRKEFNERKDDELAEVISEGMAVRKRMDEIELHLVELQAIKDKGYELYPLKDVEEIKQKIEYAKSTQTIVQNTSKYIELSDIVNKLKAKVPIVEGSVETSVMKREKMMLLAKVKELCATMGKKEVMKTIQKDIETYTQTNADIYKEIAAIEGKADSVKSYIEERAHLVSERINKKMSSCVIAMFSRQKNGELTPDCVLQSTSGIKYATMNTSSRIKSCLELQIMFCDHFGVSLPVFIDEASIFSSDNLPKFESQTILMYASDDNELVIR